MMKLLQNLIVISICFIIFWSLRISHPFESLWPFLRISPFSHLSPCCPDQIIKGPYCPGRRRKLLPPVPWVQESPPKKKTLRKKLRIWRDGSLASRSFHYFFQLPKNLWRPNVPTFDVSCVDGFVFPKQWRCKASNSEPTKVPVRSRERVHEWGKSLCTNETLILSDLDASCMSRSE